MTILLHGLQSLRQYVGKHKPSMASTPIILLMPSTSAAAADQQQQRQPMGATTSAAGVTGLAEQQIQFLLSQQYGLRTVTAYDANSMSSSMTTLADNGAQQSSSSIVLFPADDCPTMHHVIELKERIKATTIVATGDGHCLECAKTVATTVAEKQRNQSRLIENLILIPTTYPATLFNAATPYPLIINREEDMLISTPPQLSLPNVIESEHPITVLLDRQYFSSGNHKSTVEETLLAAVTIGLDTLLSSSHHDQTKNQEVTTTITNMLTDAVALLVPEDDTNTNNDNTTGENNDDADHDVAHEKIVTVLATAGSLLFSVGGDGAAGQHQQQPQHRSLILTLMSSLLPHFAFNQYQTTTFVASFLPELCAELAPQQQQQQLVPDVLLERIQRLADEKAPRTVTTESIETLMGRIRTNQIVWNCPTLHDTRYGDRIRNILQQHVF